MSTLPILLLTLTTALADPEEPWWAYQPVERHDVPKVEGVEHPIDAFIAARLGTEDLSMSPPASRRVLMRRAYLGITGLPPTIEQQDAFLGNDSPEAWPQLVEQLLGSQHYGERWARYWLDVVRYADTNGYERDGEKPDVWKYRDYVIKALNDDKSYDRFVTEQVAGDEIEGANAETLIATGFWALGPWNDEVDPLELPQYRADELDDYIGTASHAFLASTISCARCHDHKFDPFTAEDYYSLVSFVEPLKRANVYRTDLSVPVGSREELEAVRRRDEKLLPLRVDLHKRWQPHRDMFMKEHFEDPRDGFKYAINSILIAPDKRHAAEEKTARAFTKRLDDLVAPFVPDDEIKKIRALQSRIGALREETPDLEQGYIYFENSPTAPPTHFLERGNPASRGKVMAPAVPVSLTTKQPEFLPPSDRSTNRRLGLARWLVSKENPLTARVFVNRVWQHHFGNGIVSTPNDFGRVGALPTHPKLLDWLAHWFMHDANWSIKKLQRLILSSRTYQMSSAWDDTSGKKDPENRLLWRFPYQRLDVEATRDSMLAVSGALSKKMGGRGVKFRIPAVVIEGHAEKHRAWKQDPEEQRNRRTIYGFVKRSMIVPMIEALDFCDTFRSTGVRPVTTIAPQSLILFNGEFVNRQARVFAERLRNEAGDQPASQIERAYRLTLARSPSPTEAESMRAFLKNSPEGLVQLCRVLLNLNEFVHVD